MNAANFLSTAQIAKATGVGRETLRHYEKKGLVLPATRTAAGYRKFSPLAVEVIAFIKSTQQAGFTLSEIQELLALRANAANTCKNVSGILERKMDSLDSEIRALQRKRSVIASLATNCRATDAPSCSLVP